MSATGNLSFQALYTQVIGDMATAVSQRPGETKQQEAIRFQAAVQMVMAFLPRDVIEVMIAGHCVMFHELIVDSTRHTLSGEEDTTRKASRAGIATMDRCFGNNLRRLEQSRKRASEGRRDAVETAETPAGTPVAAPVAAPAAQDGVVKQPAGVPAILPRTKEATERQDRAVTGAVAAPSLAALAASKVNDVALAALEAGDPAAFARALGIDAPSEAFLAAAAAPGGPFDRTADWSTEKVDGAGAK